MDLFKSDIELWKHMRAASILVGVLILSVFWGECIDAACPANTYNLSGTCTSCPSYAWSYDGAPTCYNNTYPIFALVSEGGGGRLWGRHVCALHGLGDQEGRQLQ